MSMVGLAKSDKGNTFYIVRLGRCVGEIDEIVDEYDNGDDARDDYLEYSRSNDFAPYVVICKNTASPSKKKLIKEWDES